MTPEQHRDAFFRIVDRYLSTRTSTNYVYATGTGYIPVPVAEPGKRQPDEPIVRADVAAYLEDWYAKESAV